MSMGELLNVIGFSAGVALYAMLLAMVARGPSAGAGHGRRDPLLVSTAVLGLVWNLCALPAYELPRLGIAGPFPVLTALGFSALGILPAVVVHSVLRRERDEIGSSLKWIIAAAAYGVSAAATGLQAWTLGAGRPLPSVPAMQLLTWSYVALLLPLTFVSRGQPGARRALWAAALSIFAVSALHLGEFHQGEPSWIGELLGHHASLPLAVAILYQDFPFAFADLFLKRALTLLALVSAAFVAVVSLNPPSVAGMPGAFEVGMLVTLWVATALLYPVLRHATAWFVDSVIFSRPDYDAVRTSLAAATQRHQAVVPLLDEACERLGPALSARTIRWRELRNEAPIQAEPDQQSVAAVVEIPVAEPPRYVVEVGDLTGGRRILSDDRAFLDATATMLARRIDAIRLTDERYERELREREVSRLVAEAELRALRSQINPHFLFNALTTIGHLIQTAPSRAVDTLMRLTALLRGVLRSEGELTTLGREVELIESYLDIERARFEERLRVRIDVPAGLAHLRVPPLVLQPLVENAVKHGIGRERAGGEVVVSARLEPLDTGGSELVLAVEDTGAGVGEMELRRGRDAGVGLRNIESRLACQYGSAAALAIRSTPGRGTIVEVRLPSEQRTPELTRSGA
jgi:two-component system LytT family sensor kinase